MRLLTVRVNYQGMEVVEVPWEICTKNSAASGAPVNLGIGNTHCLEVFSLPTYFTQTH